MFNIETYIDSLPEDIEEIDVSNKGIKTLDVTRFKNLKTLNCSNNQLTSLQLNENLQILSCNNNQLTSLQLNKNLEILYCWYNRLTSLHLNEKLEKLYCFNNKLSSLHLNKKLKVMCCYGNQLSSLHLNKKLETIVYYDNPIYEIINSGVIDIIKRKIRVLNQFRYLYYSLKFKKQLRDILWVKIREPKIRIKYSHDYLVEHLHEDTDLDELLNNW
jgi:hypothetical protein